jgi:hypothetical protein
MRVTGNRALIGVLTVLPWAVVPMVGMAGGGAVDRKVNAAPNGEVVISNVSGTVDVRAWDRNEVQVTGHLDDDVERLDVESGNGRTVIKVVVPRGGSNDSDAVLEVRVPRMSTVEVSAVSADVSSRDVLGTQRLKSVSGEITADVWGNDSEIRTVSGDLTVRGNGKPINLRVSSVSGSLDLSNGAGKLDLVTVSGDARVQMGETTEVRGRTTSGNLELRAKLALNARVELEAVSGDLTVRLPGAEGLSADIESFSGDIHGCLADNVERVSKYGPGVRLNIRAVEAGAHVRAKTLSGDIDVCNQ